VAKACNKCCRKKNVALCDEKIKENAASKRADAVRVIEGFNNPGGNLTQSSARNADYVKATTTAINAMTRTV
jgi:hypothetical protein